MARSIEDAKLQLSKKAALAARVLSTPDGQALLEVIAEEFCHGDNGVKLIGSDPQQTAYRVGAYDVVLYLRQLVKFNQRTE